MKQVEVQIMGQSYILSCPEGGEMHLEEAVRKVDEAMCKIRDSGKIKARDRIAVLAALNLAFDIGQQAAGGGSSKVTESTLSNLLHRMDTALADDDQLL
ncbi:MAG: cell division protein ZapA [Betaproteobacteria bacterium]